MSDWKSLDSMTDDELNQYIASLESETFGTESEVEEPTPTKTELQEETPKDVTQEEVPQEYGSLTLDDSDYESDDPLEQILHSKFEADGITFDLSNPNDLKDVVTFGKEYIAEKPRIEELMAMKSAMDQFGIDSETFNLLLEARSGNPLALTKLLNDVEVPPYSLDILDPDIPNYKPKNYIDLKNSTRGKTIDEVLAKYNFPEEVQADIKNWDTDSQKLFVSSPAVVGGVLDMAVKKGIYSQVKQQIKRDKLANRELPYNDFEKYSIYIQQMRETKVNQEPQSEKQMNQTSYKKKQASIPRGGSTKPQTDPTEFRILTGEEMTRLSDEDLDQYQRDLEQYLASYS